MIFMYINALTVLTILGLQMMQLLFNQKNNYKDIHHFLLAKMSFTMSKM